MFSDKKHKKEAITFLFLLSFHINLLEAIWKNMKQEI